MMKQHGRGIQIGRSRRVQEKNANSVFGRKEIKSECLMTASCSV